MALVKELDWQFDENNVVASAANAAFNKALQLALKNSLIGFPINPWTVNYSCSSTVAGTLGDGVDRWVTTANLVHAFSGGNARSWIVLERVDGLQMCWHKFITSNSGEYQMEIVISPSGDFSGGTTTARPTASDQVILKSTTSGASSEYFGGENATTPNDLRFHVLHSEDGLHTRIFGGRNGVVFGHAFIENLKPVDGSTPPVMFGWHSGGSGGVVTNALTGAQMGGSNQFASVGGATATLAMTAQARPGVSTMIFDEAFGQVVSEIRADGKLATMPQGVVCITTGAREVALGSRYDAHWVQAPPALTGDTIPASGDREWAVFGKLIYPWPNVAPQV